MEEIRQLVPQDLRKLGCPSSVFERILEDRAARAEGREYKAFVTEAETRELRSAAEKWGKIIEADNAVAQAQEPRRDPVRPSQIWGQ